MNLGCRVLAGVDIPAGTAVGVCLVVFTAVEDFYTRLTADPDLGAFFETSDVTRIIAHHRMFMTAVLGGPDAYEGRDMRAAHAHLRITDADFDGFLDHLVDALTDLDVSGPDIDEVVKALEPLRLEIVSAP